MTAISYRAIAIITTMITTITLAKSRRMLLIQKEMITRARVRLHSAKGGAVETGCSDLYDVIY